MWVEKHRPQKPAQMIGNEDARLAFIRWLKNWSEKSKPALLLGPPGTGKTTVVYAASASLGYSVFELNASDVRTKARLERVLSPTLTSPSLLEERRLIFLDEVDGLYGRQDYGGLEFVMELIEGRRSPLVMAANVEEDEKVRKLISKCVVFRFKPVTPRLIELYLSHLLEREGARLPREVVQEIARSSRGDVRAAVNALQVASQMPREAVAAVGYRDVALGVKQALTALFEAGSVNEALHALRSCDAQPRDKLRALHRSVMASGVKGERLAGALEGLSKADELLGEIGVTREWRLLRYFDEMLAASIFHALHGAGVSYHEDDLPWNLKLRIWNDGRLFRSVRGRLTRFFRASRGDVVSMYIPYLTLVLGKEGMVKRFVRLMGFEDGVERILGKEADRLSEAVRA